MQVTKSIQGEGGEYQEVGIIIIGGHFRDCLPSMLMVRGGEVFLEVEGEN